LIGKLPVTLSDRSITIPMRRKGPKEHIEKFRLRKFRPELNRLRSQAARWVQDNLETLNSVEPAIPEGLHDRAVDNWTPLLCIADVLGGEWPEEARKAALLLSAESVTSEDESLRVQLLGHIRDIFREDPTNPFIPSAELITKLTEDKDSPWAEYRNGKELTVRQQAVLLAPFGIRPKLVRLGDRVQRGYLRGDFVDAWGRYLPPPPPRSVTTATSEAGTASAGKPGSVTQRLRNGSSNPPKSKPVQRSNAGNGSKEGGVDGVLRSASPYHDRTDSI
jgi:hypothetical protein